MQFGQKEKLSQNELQESWLKYGTSFHANASTTLAAQMQFGQKENSAKMSFERADQNMEILFMPPPPSAQMKFGQVKKLKTH